MRSTSLLVALALYSASLSARADTFNFSFGSSSDTFSGSGILSTGTAEVSGEYPIVSVTGTAETSPSGASVAIRSILDPGTFPTPTNGNSFPANDNVLFVDNGIGTLSQDGLSFLLSNGAQINLFNDGAGLDALLERNNGKDVSEAVPISITALAPVPEPSTLSLLGSGLLAIAGVAKRRFL